MTRCAHTLLGLFVAAAMGGCANLPESSEPVEPSDGQLPTPVAELTCEELKLAIAAVASTDTKTKMLAKMKTDTARRAGAAAHRNIETAGSDIAAVHNPPAYAESRSKTRREQQTLRREFAERCEAG